MALASDVSVKDLAVWDVAVIGAGAAGMLAAARAAERGLRVVLVEKNRKAGVKILMSGGTRCNITQATDRRGIVTAFGAQGPFLHSALAALGPDELVAMFHAEGVATKVEPTGKVFPVSDRAIDVRDALLRMLERAGAELRLGEAVVDIIRGEANFQILTERVEVVAEKVILTTGGQSYPGCGTTGDGYAWAKQWGHTIVPPRPALVPLRSPASWVHELSGVTIPDVKVQILGSESTKPLAERRGSFLFTHFGLSGPGAMDVSRAITANPDAPGWQAVCDFLPATTRGQLLEQLSQQATENGKRAVSAIANEWLPRRLAEALLTKAKTTLDHRVAELGKQQRNQLVDAIKCQAIPLSGSLGFKKAEVTAGGVDLAEVDSRNMQSKLVPGLYLAGEILDLDGPIGGYNFQAAFSTGWLAGESV
jgi:predicted Rossmann fold flavoprotein